MRVICVFLLLLGTLTVVGAASSSQGTQTQDEQALRQIEAATAKGEQQNDVGMMKFFASDFVFSGRKVLSKQQLEEAVRSNFAAHGNGPSPVTIEKKNISRNRLHSLTLRQAESTRVTSQILISRVTGNLAPSS